MTSSITARVHAQQQRQHLCTAGTTGRAEYVLSVLEGRESLRRRPPPPPPPQRQQSRHDLDLDLDLGLDLGLGLDPGGVDLDRDQGKDRQGHPVDNRKEQEMEEEEEEEEEEMEEEEEGGEEGATLGGGGVGGSPGKRGRRRHHDHHHDHARKWSWSKSSFVSCLAAHPELHCELALQAFLERVRDPELGDAIAFAREGKERKKGLGKKEDYLLTYLLTYLL